jgi:hypothetical protein
MLLCKYTLPHHPDRAFTFSCLGRLGMAANLYTQAAFLFVGGFRITLKVLLKVKLKVLR